VSWLLRSVEHGFTLWALGEHMGGQWTGRMHGKYRALGASGCACRLHVGVMLALVLMGSQALSLARTVGAFHR